MHWYKMNACDFWAMYMYHVIFVWIHSNAPNWYMSMHTTEMCVCICMHVHMLMYIYVLCFKFDKHSETCGTRVMLHKWWCVCCLSCVCMAVELYALWWVCLWRCCKRVIDWRKKVDIHYHQRKLKTQTKLYLPNKRNTSMIKKKDKEKREVNSK